MIKQSDLALAAWKATERTLDSVVTINKIDYKTTDIASISYDAGGYTGDTFGIGSNYENSVTIKFSHLIEGLKPGMTVLPKIGIKTSNGYEYSSLGLFIVSDDIQMDRNNDETTIKAYDQMCLLEGTYTSKLTYPAKMTSVIAEIANLAGVLLNTTDISHLPVQVNLPSAITGQTYRNAIGMIAQFYAGFATFDRDGKLTIRTITEPDYTLDPSQYEQGGLTKNEAPYKIGGIQCEVTTTTTDSTGQSTETTNTLQVGATSGSQIKLTNNLMTMDRLASIWQQLQSLTFYPFSLNWFGNPAIEAGDWLTLQDTKGNKFNVPNNGYTMTFDGSLSAVSKADQTSTSSSSYAWRGELSQYVADLGGRQGASGNYIYGTDTTEPPYGAKFNDIWYKQNGNKVELWTYERQADGTGKWVLTVSDATGEEVKAKVDQVELEAKASTDAAKAASDKADQLAAKYDDTNALANQAMDKAVGAQSDASSAVAKANSTASGFGKVDQKADSALTAALNAQTNASTAVSQASSAAADSKDAKQIAGAVSQSYKTLTDGSTMTIAELENGLATKLTKTDLDGYATETWTQNQIKVTADGINATLSSVKSTVDGQTTSINDLKADSSSFKSQFTTVNNTLGKQTTDISTLQTTSKELTTGFNTLTTDNTTNKNDISQLKQTATEVSSTLETVKTQVQNIGNLTHSFNANTSHPGYTSGVDGTLNDWTPHNEHRIDYAPIDPTKSYFIEVTATVPANSTDDNFNWLGFTFYDRDKKFISRVDASGVKMTVSGQSTTRIAFNYSDPTAARSVTIPANAAYVIPQARLYSDGVVTWGEYFATQTWTQNQIQMTADSINGTISSVKSTVDGHTTSINDLKADSSGFKAQFTTVNNTIGKHTTDIGTLQASTKSLSASFDSLSSDNNTNKHNISQLQATSSSFSSTLMTVQQQVQDSAVGTNLYRDTRDFDNPGVWNRYDSWTKTGEIYNGMTAVSTTHDWDGLSQTWAVKKGETYTFSIYAKYESGTGNSNLYCRGIDNVTSDNTDIGAKAVSLNSTWQRVSVTFLVTADGYVCPRLERTSANTNKLIVAGPKLERGPVMTDYSTSPLDNATVTAVSSISQTIDSIQTTVRGKVDNDTYQADVKILKNQISSVVKKSDDNWSSIQQNSSDISLRVEKKGVINAVNVSTEGIQIYGDKLHITATTYIDDAIIKDAMIESIKADKIKVGTLDATKVNIIHLNANNITAGIINGSNLTINLDTGNVEFQKGRVHSADNAIDINIDNKYISVANSSNRVMLKDGEMQFVQPGVLDLQTSPYFRIHNRGGLAFGGAEMVGRDYVTVSNAANSDDFFMHTLGVEKFSGLFTGYNRASGEWRPTKVAGAERGVIISGGSVTSGQTLASSPSIIVGYSNSSSNLTGGNRILLDAAFVHSFSTYTKTSSQSPNVYVSTDGALLRSTSASKYKTNIVRGYSTDYGKKLIQLPTATWIDKASVKRYNDDPSQPVPILNYGMIAEDLADAGLEQLVVRNKEGELEGIQYDRIAVALLPLLSEWKQIIDNQQKEINELKNKKEQ
ncbi:hypothetical protein DM37_05180 [Lactiplantibacillus plantarum]|uniref:phage head spike fiber domain-containing protein n=1 Tax=Lactiplantibacillus plantarum TaxID=1590 RepID=UPI00106511A4|nr:hypothetical protein [Lactiplantibacillus plantarum]TEA95674.1 hypothetical protein DM37_05180 [Lactiplantibacillus plantarum]